MKNENGFALVESISAIAIIGAVIFVILLVAYFYFAKVTVSNTGYNALICVAESQPSSLCKSEARDTIQKRLPFGHLDRVHVQSNRGWFRVNIHWTLYNDHKINYSNSLRY